MPSEIGAMPNKAIAWDKDRTGLRILSDDPEDRNKLVQRLQRLSGLGKALDEATRSRMESLLGYDLRDVRVHDSRQAAELAERLGAHAFTLRSHIFGPGEKLSLLTPEGGGLLAHEITHVIQQTKPRKLSQRSGWPAASPPELSRITLQTQTPLGHATRPVVASKYAERINASSQAEGRFLRPSPTTGQSGNVVSLKVEGGLVQREAEAEAETSEHMVSMDLENRQEPENERPTTSQVSHEEIANKVYRLMLQDLLIQRERGSVLK